MGVQFPLNESRLNPELAAHLLRLLDGKPLFVRVRPGASRVVTRKHWTPGRVFRMRTSEMAEFLPNFHPTDQPVLVTVRDMKIQRQKHTAWFTGPALTPTKPPTAILADAMSAAVAAVLDHAPVTGQPVGRDQPVPPPVEKPPEPVAAVPCYLVHDPVLGRFYGGDRGFVDDLDSALACGGGYLTRGFASRAAKALARYARMEHAGRVELSRLEVITREAAEELVTAPDYDAKVAAARLARMGLDAGPAIVWDDGGQHIVQDLEKALGRVGATAAPRLTAVVPDEPSPQAGPDLAATVAASQIQLPAPPEPELSEEQALEQYATLAGQVKDVASRVKFFNQGVVERRAELNDALLALQSAMDQQKELRARLQRLHARVFAE